MFTVNAGKDSRGGSVEWNLRNLIFDLYQADLLMVLAYIFGPVFFDKVVPFFHIVVPN